MTKIVTVQSQQKWDYFFESRRTETSLLLALNEYGQQGWELVDVLYFKDPKGIMAWGAFLKRPNAGQAPVPGQPPAASAHAPSGSPGQAEAKPGVLQGFDLSGDEFQIKSE